MTVELAADLPDEITYGFVADRVLLAVGDTADDEDRYPDGVPAQGSVIFTPVTPIRHTDEPPATVIKSRIECTIRQGDDDDAGLLVDPAGHVGNVALVTGFYDVKYQLETGSVPGFRIHVTEDHTDESPLWLPRHAPVIPSPVERFVVNEQVYIDTLAARDEVRETLDGLSNPLDTAIDATLTNPESESRQSLLSTIDTRVEEAAPQIIEDHHLVTGGSGVRKVSTTMNPDRIPEDGELLILIPRTQWWTDFSGYTVGEQPHDWTRHWGTAEWTVQTSPDGTGGVLLRNPEGGGSSAVLAWDEIGSVTDAEIAVRWRTSHASIPMRAVTRVTPAPSPATARDAYMGGLTNNNTNNLQLIHDGTATTLDTEPAGRFFTAGTWYITRLRTVGSSQYTKTWEASEPEPAEWHATAEDTTLTGPGLVGLRRPTVAQSREVDWVGVGINGSPAPIGPVN